MHIMKLNDKYFNYIKNGTKKYEIRLNDEKRRKILVGDYIEFKCLPLLNSSIIYRVKDLLYFNNFEDVISSIDIEYLADKDESKSELLNSLNTFYSEYEVDKYGVVLIELDKNDTGIIKENKRKIVFMTSTLDMNEKDEFGNKTPKMFPNNNGIIDNLKKYITAYDNFLFVASDEYNNSITDMYANIAFSSFNMTLPFKNYNILDSRTKDKKEELIRNADLIYLCGGHVPHQLDFFEDINLRELIQKSDAVIVGASAGSMDCAETVYVAPEEEGESIDPNFKRYRKGLGLTNTNILPHYNSEEEIILDGKNFINDIVLPDSYKKEIIALVDGSYILINENGDEKIYGESYTIKNGKISENKYE